MASWGRARQVQVSAEMMTRTWGEHGYTSQTLVSVNMQEVLGFEINKLWVSSVKYLNLSNGFFLIQLFLFRLGVKKNISLKKKKSRERVCESPPSWLVCLARSEVGAGSRLYITPHLHHRRPCCAASLETALVSAGGLW